jgi:hypothetical protein
MIEEGLLNLEDLIDLTNRNGEEYAYIEVEEGLFYFANSDKEPFDVEFKWESQQR